MPNDPIDPRDPRFTSANAPRVTQNAQGGWQLNEHGNTRQLQGDEVDKAKGYAEEFWKNNPTGWQGGEKSEASLGDAYKQLLGRDPDAAGLAAHQKNPGGLPGAIAAIRASDEFQNQPAPTITNMGLGGGAGAAGAPGAAGGAPGAAGQWTPQVFQGFTPKHAMEGFDFNREQNTGKSAKDAFAYLSNQAPPPPINDKAALAGWFNQYIKPGMDALGHKVTSVEGDKFGFENWQGKFNVDYGRGAGAEGGALAWQVDDPSAVMSNQAYTPGAARTMAPTSSTMPVRDPSAGGGSQDQLRAQIQALIAGGNPLEAQALLDQLQG